MASSKIREFLLGQQWDSPFFKRLAHNDTGKAVGHQGGLVVPKPLRRFFPSLDEGRTSRTKPTVDRGLFVEMFLGLRQVGEARVRYQFQTWGGERSPESRLTENLGPIYREANSGDILVFQRSADTLNRFRLTLFQQDSIGFREINRLTEGSKWGTLLHYEPPITDEDLKDALEELDNMANQPFVARIKRKRVDSRRSTIARSSAFPVQVRKQYEWTCAVSGVLLMTPPPSGICEVQAAHVIPVNEGGTDDPRNGLALAQTLHWAFDWGLFGIRENRRVYLPRRVRTMRNNSFLRELAGHKIREARAEKFRVHSEALAWHMLHRVKKWD
jgi:putative restriction endonuclease